MADLTMSLSADSEAKESWARWLKS